MFKRILIANRGEIACRIARTCRRLGIEYVAVYSSADAGAEHLKSAAASMCIGDGPATASYLDGAKLLEAALRTECEAVHPGYGFLSENSSFAASIENAGLVFIGPAPETIAALGDKARARRLMTEAGVPVVPGTMEASDDRRHLEEQIRAIGLPVLLKPSAGGGGKGMQVIADFHGLGDVIASAIRVARSSFGDGRLIAERYIENPRHIEVQIFGDGNGNAVHLFERECSLQRRHQKVIEEAPAPNLPAHTRERLLEAAVQGARSLNYRNAGTFEFIVGPDSQFYFLEVNTRLQVEHPVTEEITGLDLVEWQLSVAAGNGLPLSQAQISYAGHAMEARIYAEDPAQDFRPAPGRAVSVRWPGNLRVDASFSSAGNVPPYYDPMVAKIISRGCDRNAALSGLRQGLRDSVLLGIKSNMGYLLRVLDDPGVREGRIHTRYLDQHKELQVPDAGPSIAVMAALLLPRPADPRSPWAAGTVDILDRRHLDTDAPFGRVRARIDMHPAEVRIISLHGDSLTVRCMGRDWIVSRDEFCLCGTVQDTKWHACHHGSVWFAQVDGDHYILSPFEYLPPETKGKPRAAIAPMSGVISALPVKPGDKVHPGDVLVVIEAMKMEHAITADAEGIVQSVRYGKGESVREGELIVELAYGATESDAEQLLQDA